MKSSLRLLLVAGALVAQTAFASTITNGFTYAVANGGGATTTGNHFHSNTGGSFGNPAGKAEVGNYSTEQVRGLSEYSLAALVAGPAFVTFDVFKAGGLFNGTNDFTFNGTINVYAYQGNNSEDVSDYQAAGSLVGSFATGGLLVGSIISMDITSQYNNALSNSWSSLGIRLERVGATSATTGAWTFDDFRLTSNNQTTANIPDASSTVALLGLAMVGLVAFRRKVAA